MEIIFFGNQRLVQGIRGEVTTITDALRMAGHEVVGEILMREDLGRVSELKERYPGAVGCLASFGYIVPASVIELFEPMGILNIHPSLLPKYRGSSPIETAILNGDTMTGVSVMKIVQRMDAGVLYAQREVAVLTDDDKFSLCARMTEVGAEMLVGLLDDVVKNTKTGVAQDESVATYTRRLEKAGGWLKPEEFAAEELERQVRAFLEFPKSKYEFFGILCTVVKARVSDVAVTELDLHCQDGRYLVVERLIPAGRKEMAAADFLRGYGKSPKEFFL